MAYLGQSVKLATMDADTHESVYEREKKHIKSEREIVVVENDPLSDSHHRSLCFRTLGHWTSLALDRDGFQSNHKQVEIVVGRVEQNSSFDFVIIWDNVERNKISNHVAHLQVQRFQKKKNRTLFKRTWRERK